MENAAIARILGEVADLLEIRVLKGIEVDILADGSLDLSDEMLERLDLVIASVHSRAWLGPADVINCRGPEELTRFLRRVR